MIIGSSGYNINASVLKSFAERLSIFHYHAGILFKFRLQSFFQAYRLGSDHMHQRASLDSRENSFVKVKFLCIFCAAHDQSASWASQCLMCGCCYNVSIRDRAWMLSACHKTGNMSHIHHKICSRLVCNLTELLKINGAGIGTGTCDDHFGLTFQRNPANLVIVQDAVIIYSIGNRMEIST